MTTEAFTAHLKETGKFDEFKARRQALEMHGADKKESWTQAADDFGYKVFAGKPASARATSSSPAAAIESAAAEVFEGKSSSLRADFQWVYENVAVDDVEPSDAPSAGAWGLLQFARSDTRTFYAEWMKMAAKADDMEAIHRERVEDAARSTAEITSMLRDLRAAVLEGDPEDGAGESGVEAEDAREGGD
jgi:hypothetical protein